MARQYIDVPLIDPSAQTSSTPTYLETSKGADLLRNPAFLNDLRQHYRSKGVAVSTMTNDDLVDRFYSDQTWQTGHHQAAPEGAVQAGLPAQHPGSSIPDGNRIREKHRPSTNKSGIQHRGQDFIVFSGKRQTLLQRAGGVADIQTNVPQRINHFLDQIFSFFGDLFFK